MTGLCVTRLQAIVQGLSPCCAGWATFLLQAWVAQSECTTLTPVPAALPAQPAPRRRLLQEHTTTNAKGFQQVTAWQVGGNVFSCASNTLVIAGPKAWEISSTGGLANVPNLLSCSGSSLPPEKSLVNAIIANHRHCTEAIA